MEDIRHFGKWVVRREISTNTGQADVYEVFDGTGLPDAAQASHMVKQAFERLSPATLRDSDQTAAGVEALRHFVEGSLAVATRPGSALKVIKRERDSAQMRFEQEVAILRKLEHPSLIPIIDADVGDGWFVTTLYEGTLAGRIGSYRGDGLRLLKTIRPIVDAVSRLHSNGIVHRDIKPDNIFVAQDMDLVLGDFGLAFDANDDGTRVTTSLERTGSRDWMPPWANLGRLDEVDPRFDVYTLGKVVWSMALGQLRLPHRYGVDGRFDITFAHFAVDEATIIDDLVKVSVDDRQHAVLGDASEFLRLIDRGIARLAHGFSDVRLRHRQCRVCGEGRYEVLSDRNGTNQRNFGLEVVGDAKFKILVCSHCAHVQLFYFRDGLTPKAWEDQNGRV